MRVAAPELPAPAAIKAAIVAALGQTFASEAPNAWNGAPLHPALRAQIAARPNPGFEIHIALLDDQAVRQLNLEHRGKDKPTDVLSFAVWEGESFPAPPDDPFISLGDAVISVETAIKQAAELGHDLRTEMAFLAVHGALHLLGYDHASPTGRRQMFALQDQIVARVREDNGF